MKIKTKNPLFSFFALVGLIFVLIFYGCIMIRTYKQAKILLFKDFEWQVTEVYPKSVNLSLTNDNLAIYEVTSETIREVSAYNAGDINQCSGNPCISANGENICNALEMGYKRCASNFVPLGTRLFIDNYGECLVTDRLNKRYKNRVDIAMKLDEKQRALKWGIQNLNVKILK